MFMCIYIFTYYISIYIHDIYIYIYTSYPSIYIYIYVNDIHFGTFPTNNEYCCLMLLGIPSGLRTLASLRAVVSWLVNDQAAAYCEE